MSGTFGQDDPQLNLDTQGDPLENALDQSGVGMPAAPEPPAVYKAMPDSRIPVSSKRGGLWRSRRDVAQKQMKNLIDAWDEAIRYYNHDQADHRDGTDVNVAGNRNVARRLNERFSSTENVVFANVNAQIPELYAKNPIVTVTNEQAGDPVNVEAGDAFARAVQRLVDALFRLRYPPGVNLKPKAKRNVVIALLTNCAWFEVGYVNKDKSSEQGVQDLLGLSKQLAEAEDDEEIREIEQKLVALEQKVEFLQPSGPYVRVRLPHQVLVDGDSNDPHLSDANWVMIEDMLPTEFINAVYGEENEDTDEVKSIFEPTHVLSSGSSGR